MKFGCYFLLLFWVGQLGAQVRGARLPYIRYGSEGSRVREARMVADPEATGRHYMCLEAQGAYIEWTVRAAAQGFDLRFTLPDNAEGTGMSDPFPTRQEKRFMRFDEVHFRLKAPVRAGDTIRLRKDGKDTTGYGVDFIELEPLPAVIGPPAGALSVTSYGAVPDDQRDDWAGCGRCDLWGMGAPDRSQSISRRGGWVGDPDDQ